MSDSLCDEVICVRFLVSNIKSFDNDLKEFTKSKNKMKKSTALTIDTELQKIMKTINVFRISNLGQNLDHKVSINQNDIEKIKKIIHSTINDISDTFNHKVAKLYSRDFEEILRIIEKY